LDLRAGLPHLKIDLRPQFTSLFAHRLQIVESRLESLHSLAVEMRLGVEPAQLVIFSSQLFARNVFVVLQEKDLVE
jgi:hypothetical protein